MRPTDKRANNCRTLETCFNKIQQAVVTSGGNSDGLAVELARCFLRLANLPNFALDRLSRYEASLWRQAGQILYALETLDRRKPQERNRYLRFNINRYDRDGY